MKISSVTYVVEHAEKCRIVNCKQRAQSLTAYAEDSVQLLLLLINELAFKFNIREKAVF
jgi:hypothetical protein